ALVIPCFIYLVWFIFSSQVIMAEGLSGTQAMARSKDLGTGYGWRIFGVFVLLLLIQILVNLAASLSTLVLPNYERVPTDFGPRLRFIYENYVINTLIAFVVGAVSGAYQAVCITLLYFDLRIRKEGFDLQVMAEQWAEPPSQETAEGWTEPQ